ncbi:hypothetical protein CE91St28_06920 [Pyramidobacter piscolens]|nr:hypothetical protein CE91St28_06920 [Pyramidobacter piscolens]
MPRRHAPCRENVRHGIEKIAADGFPESAGARFPCGRGAIAKIQAFARGSFTVN